MKNTIMAVILSAVVFGAGGFWGGTFYQKSKNTLPSFSGGNRPDFANRTGQPTDRAGSGMGMVRGEIIDVNDDSVTVKMNDETSKIVIISDETKFTTSQETDKESLAEGMSVNVFGVTNSDGSVTAESVQENPFVMDQQSN